MTRWNFFLLAAFLASVGANWFIEPSASRPNYEYLPEMAHSPAFKSFTENPNWPDRKTLQAPVPGTLTRDAAPLHYGPSPEEAVRAGRELRNPFSANDPAALERGRAVWTAFCQPCHGAGAIGDGPVALRGYPAPPNLLTGKAVQYPDGQIFHIVTYGQRNMPGYAVQIAPEDRWKVILYVRSLQEEAARKAGAAKPKMP